MLTDPRDILTAFKTLLEGIELPVAYGGMAFQEVRIFDFEDLAKAIEELFAFKDRVAFVILENVQHQVEIMGRQMTCRRTVDLTVLLADRHWGNRQLALMGDVSSTPGAIQLADLVVDAVTGEHEGLTVKPGTGEIFALEGRARDNAPGRIAWRQEFTVAGGRLLERLSREAEGLVGT